MLRLCALAFALACLGPPETARAWTRARVRDVRAEVVVGREATAQVTFDIGIEVFGGWLERFELEGLDEHLSLAGAEAAWLTTDNGRVLPARATSDAGAITLHFHQRGAARRGLHRIGVRYTTPLAVRPAADDASRVEFAWGLPGWEHGLSRADIVVRGPRGLSAVVDATQAVVLTQGMQQGQSVLAFARELLPRGTPWQVAVRGPASGFSRGSVTGPAITGRPLGVATRAALVGLALALFVLALGLASRRTFRRHATLRSVTARPRVASPRLRLGLLGLLTACATWGATWSVPVMLTALLGLGFVLIDRVEVAAFTTPLGRFVPLDRALQRASRARLLREWLGSSPVADGATLTGLLGGSALLGVAIWWAPRDLTLSLGLLCALPLWAGSSRLRLPRSAAEQLALLRASAARALALSCTMRLVGFSVGEAQPGAPRLRVVPAARFSGLLRMDVAVDTRRTLHPLVLIAVVQPDSLSDRALLATVRHGTRELSPRGQRVAYVLPVSELGFDLESWFSVLAAHSQRAIKLAEASRAA